MKSSAWRGSLPPQPREEVLAHPGDVAAAALIDGIERGAGLLAHTLFLYYRGTHSGTSPLSSQRDWFLVAAWLLAATG